MKFEGEAFTVKTEVCIPYLGYAPCNSRGMYFIPQSYREHTLGMEYILLFLQCCHSDHPCMETFSDVQCIYT